MNCGILVEFNNYVETDLTLTVNGIDIALTVCNYATNVAINDIITSSGIYKHKFGDVRKSINALDTCFVGSEFNINGSELPNEIDGVYENCDTTPVKCGTIGYSV